LDLAKRCRAPIPIARQMGKKTTDSNGFAPQHANWDGAA
jgi:hypothetical protein